MKHITFNKARLYVVKQVKKYETEQILLDDGTVELRTNYSKPYYEVELSLEVPEGSYIEQ